MNATLSDTTQQNGDLTEKQMAALDLMLVGASDQKIAEEISVTRSTVWRWRNENPYFRAELNKRRQIVWMSLQDQLRGLAERSLSVLGDAIDAGDTKVAVEIIKSMTKLGNIEIPSGETSPQAILWREAKERAEYESWFSDGPQTDLNGYLNREIDKFGIAVRRMYESCEEHNVKINHSAALFSRVRNLRSQKR
jgi:hypothetical protein